MFLYHFSPQKSNFFSLGFPPCVAVGNYTQNIINIMFYKNLILHINQNKSLQFKVINIILA